MKVLTTLALAALTLAIGVPAASAAQPDALDRYLQANPPASVPDAIDRYRSSNPATPAPVPDVIDRYLWNNEAPPSATGAADHPDSLAVRPTVVGEPASVSDGGRDWETGALGAFVGLLIALLVGSTTVLRDHRRLAH